MRGVLARYRWKSNLPEQVRDPDPGQLLLLPPSRKDWLPEGHLANFSVDVVEDIDLAAIERVIHAKDPRGTRPCAPRG